MKTRAKDSSLTHPRSSVVVKVLSQQPTSSVTPDKCFPPFVFDDFESLTGHVEDQSFILSDTLPFRAESVCDTNTIVPGSETGFIPVPLYHV